jgi:hypothetical protein
MIHGWRYGAWFDFERHSDIHHEQGARSIKLLFMASNIDDIVILHHADRLAQSDS